MRGGVHGRAGGDDVVQQHKARTANRLDHLICTLRPLEALLAGKGPLVGTAVLDERVEQRNAAHGCKRARDRLHVVKAAPPICRGGHGHERHRVRRADHPAVALRRRALSFERGAQHDLGDPFRQAALARVLVRANDAGGRPVEHHRGEASVKVGGGTPALRAQHVPKRRPAPKTRMGGVDAHHGPQAVVAYERARALARRATRGRQQLGKNFRHRRQAGLRAHEHPSLTCGFQCARRTSTGRAGTGHGSVGNRGPIGVVASDAAAPGASSIAGDAAAPGASVGSMALRPFCIMTAASEPPRLPLRQPGSDTTPRKLWHIPDAT